MEIPIKKASDRHICFAGPTGHFCSYHESLHLFATAMVIKKGTLRTTPFLTKAHPHSGTEVKGARQMCKRPPPRNSNMQAPGSTQNKYASTRWHAKQMCRHLAARKTNMEAPGGTQNKYAGSQQQEKNKCAGTRQHAKEIRKHAVACKTNMPSPGGTQNTYGLHLVARTANMQATVPAHNKYAGTRQHAKQIFKHLLTRKTHMPPASTRNKYGSIRRRTKTNMQAPCSTQNKYASTCWHAKQICHHLAARKTNMEAPGGTQNKSAASRQHEKTNMRAPGSTQKKYARLRWRVKQTNMP